jgi:hypothetical protein
LKIVWLVNGRSNTGGRDGDGSGDDDDDDVGDGNGDGDSDGSGVGVQLLDDCADDDAGAVNGGGIDVDACTSIDGSSKVVAAVVSVAANSPPFRLLQRLF